MTDEVTVVEEMSMTCVMRFSHYMHSISLSPHDTVQLVMSIPDLLTALSNTVQKVCLTTICLSAVFQFSLNLSLSANPSVYCGFTVINISKVSGFGHIRSV